MLTQGNTSLTDLDALAFGRGPGSFTGVRIGIGIAQGLALGAELPMIGVSTLATMAQGAWRMTGATRVLAAIDARMGEVYWAEYTRDENGVWHGEETEAVLTPEAVTERLKQLSGEWATVGTGWPAWPEMGNDTGVTLVDGNMLLPAAEDMLPLACQLFAKGKTVAVEQAEPVYLRNTVAWKKLPGRE
jgi:tRNA threonylcarbamoyladenosine biosynthesis protein TsaB